MADAQRQEREGWDVEATAQALDEKQVSDEAPRPQKLTIRHVLAVGTGALLCFSSSAIVFNTWSIFVVPVSTELGIASSQFTVLITIIFLSCSVMASPLGNLMEKLDLRIVLSVSVALCGTGVLLCSQWTEIWQFYLSGVLEGTGVVALSYLASPTLVNRWFNSHMGVLVGICVAMMGVGGAVWSMVGGVLIGDLGWRSAYLVLGGAVLALGLPATLFCIRSYPSDIGLQPYGEAERVGADEGMQWGVSAKKAFRSPAFYLLALTIALFNGTGQAGNMLPTYVYHLGDTGLADITPALAVMVASAVAMCMQASQAVAKVCLGAIADRSIVVALCVACACGFTGTVCCWLGYSSTALIYTGSVLFGALYGATNVLGPTIARHLFGPREYTKIYSRIAVFINIAPAISVTLFATLSEIGWDLEFATVLGIIVAILVMGIVTMRLGKHLEQTLERKPS
ncbi:MFS transporter [Enteroscipio rubneri]|uniref:Major facilitator superfamily (MFS) profile domain-containing protein n=1 Tax=Enteroscipio rubneri TaxID=2070686 RepID=A0A2K2UCS7_9ACTN|nr:MFS transporter [Enteroscipio rubneri]PNV68018.1 hypothetical protein C2L71_04000 [Enteroscipio rubneri]